ncbi:MAG: chorismate-binding protein [Anaerolineae bacterium]
MSWFEREPGSAAAAHHLTAFFDAAIAARLAVAIWRQPGQADVSAIADLSGAARPSPIHFGLGAPVFTFSPFATDTAHPPLQIHADVRLDNNGLHAQSALWNGQRQRFETFSAAYQSHLNAPQTPTRWHLPADAQPVHSANQADYCRLVHSAIEFIAASGVKKVVVSRAATATLPAAFSPVSTLLALCQRYPAAFVSLVAIPDVGTWIGASPELLLSTDHRGLHTIALAGTQARTQDAPLAATRWHAKEIEEQALVSDYIRDFFQRAGAATVQETGPHTVAAGNVVHLRTDFHVTLPPAQLLSLADRVLHELHPTSAVCGMPKDKALAFILQHEGYNRSFYSGYLGPMHVDGETHLYVNLRCMELGRGVATLYVGGGITADSDPCAEWRETELKADTLLAVLRAQETVHPARPLAVPA